MKLRMELSLDNDSLAGEDADAPEELDRIFRRAINSIAISPGQWGTSGALRDSNGNTIGHWQIVG